MQPEEAFHPWTALLAVINHIFEMLNKMLHRQGHESAQLDDTQLSIVVIAYVRLRKSSSILDAEYPNVRNEILDAIEHFITLEYDNRRRNQAAIRPSALSSITRLLDLLNPRNTEPPYIV
jgi:septum formation topological specificity factor MinE